MPKYQNEYRQTIGETEIDESVMQQTRAEPEPTDPEEATFKKRYGDLRRHMQQQMAQRDAEMQALQQQLASATKQQIKFPKSESEVAEWAKKYPDVANIVDTIAQKRVQEALAVGEKKLEEVRQFERQVKREKAETELRQIHPDFDTIRASKQFHDWVVEQPKYVQDALYKNNTDAKAAARAIDLYKADKGIKKRRARNTGNAAQSVGITGSTPPSTGGIKFKESQVANMNAREYEKNEQAIMEAVRQGNFEYDISQATN